MKEKLVVIIGPTAVGKTELSIKLAKQLPAEIISGDSMQVYKGMDIGTAKIKREEQEEIPHHLIDILHPHEHFSVMEFQRRATELISELNRKKIIPLLVGGTGLYVQAVTQQFTFAAAPESKDLRRKWEEYLQENGAYAVHEELAKRDPLYAHRLHPHNSRRVIRALEMIELTGKSMAEYQGDWHKKSPYDVLMFGLTMDREKLYERIHLRVDHMLEEGLIEETQKLLQDGVSPSSTSMQAIGYKEMIQYVQGKISKEEAVQLLKRNTRRFAKRQLTWFRRMPDIHWYDLTDQHDSLSAVLEKIKDDIEGKWGPLENIYNDK